MHLQASPKNDLLKDLSKFEQQKDICSGASASILDFCSTKFTPVVCSMGVMVLGLYVEVLPNKEWQSEIYSVQSVMQSWDVCCTKFMPDVCCMGVTVQGL